ncbi:cell cycle checkpoint protein RAD17 isoform X2 [Cryptomeria japonica]|uniref:cell cycle checkpoint protein RAD17 isoform X2 n=1 Tax=Cryptomeria japonica TaxID=3369 RepID=UPI0027DAA915|nr:cell cycle checkpoint protein RAD17 isoform X2 [Cryptomeria japonica]
MMGKRPRQLVVISDSDEEDYNHNAHSSKSTVHDSKFGVHGERKKLKNDKRSSRCTIRLQKENLFQNEDWPALLPETFSEASPLQQQPIVSNRNQRPPSAQKAETVLWADKYKPKTLMDLAVNKKKVAEIKAWIEEQLNSSMEPSGHHVLLLTGPTGVGKTATVHLIRDLLRIEMHEWETPAPTLWREYIHHVNSGTSYISKFDEFEAFVSAIKKFPVYMGSSKGAGRFQNAMVILIDDLPVPTSREACQQLCRCLRILALSAQFPTIVLVTDFPEAGDREGPGRMILELELALEQGGATKIAFNPLTAKAIMKTLTKIWKTEYLSPPPDWLRNISENSGGDIRHAINSLQYLCLGQVSGTWDPGGIALELPESKSRRQSQKKVVHSYPSLSCLEFTDKVNSSMGRDGSLSLFHALGKFLHNKRETDQIADSVQGSVVMKEKFVRNPLKMDMPEVVLSQAHAEAGMFSAFLHENVLDFISEEAIDDAWMALSYLSDSDCLLGASNCRYQRRTKALLEWDEVNSAFVVESISGSVMTRGVLFGNSHPAPPRWQSIRGPALWQVERSSHKKRIEMFSERLASSGLFKTSSLSVLATEYKPVMQMLGQPAFHVQLESLRGYNEEWDKQHWDYEEIEAPEIDSAELDNLISDGNILSTLDINDNFTNVNSRLSEIPEEMDADEIEEW